MDEGGPSRADIGNIGEGVTINEVSSLPSTSGWQIPSNIMALMTPRNLNADYKDGCDRTGRKKKESK
jgi:hypothetical protein